jgi:hypothetical protein
VLEIVIAADVLKKNVDNDVGEIQQYPHPFLPALGRAQDKPSFAEFFLDQLGDRACPTLGRSAADHEIIAEVRHFSHIQDGEVFCLSFSGQLRS